MYSEFHVKYPRKNWDSFEWKDPDPRWENNNSPQEASKKLARVGQEIFECKTNADESPRRGKSEVFDGV